MWLKHEAAEPQDGVGEMNNENEDMTLEREFEIEAGKFYKVGSPEYKAMVEDYRDNFIDCPDDMEPGSFYWEFRHEIAAEFCQELNDMAC